MLGGCHALLRSDHWNDDWTSYDFRWIVKDLFELKKDLSFEEFNRGRQLLVEGAARLSQSLRQAVWWILLFVGSFLDDIDGVQALLDLPDFCMTYLGGSTMLTNLLRACEAQNPRSRVVDALRARRDGESRWWALLRVSLLAYAGPYQERETPRIPDTSA